LVNDFITGGGSAKSKSGVEALMKNIASVLTQGESNTLEFKSSARWDYHQTKHNKALEMVVAKTLAGFLNSEDAGRSS